jgi:HAD superfamily hydrolase (TIGR01509 family)
MIRAIIFDLYGVLAINGWQAFKTEHFSSREDVWDQVHQLGRKVDAGISDYAELVRFTSDVTGESEATVRYQLEHTVANRDLLHFIQAELKGNYKLGLLSNTSRPDVIEDVFSVDQRKLFDAVVMSRQTGILKPDKRAYELMADEIGVLIEDCLLIDDQERHVDGARRAGMQALLFTSVVDLQQELATVL